MGQVDTKKTTLREKDALALVSQVDEIYASRGKGVIHMDLRKTKPDKATLGGVLLGPTGNLRATTIRKDRTLIVGSDEATYTKVFG